MSKNHAVRRFYPLVPRLFPLPRPRCKWYGRRPAVAFSHHGPAGGENPAILAAEGQSIVVCGYELWYPGTNEQAHSLATMGLDSLGSPVFQTDGPMPSHEPTSGDSFHGQG
jgi:hypothetical protein